MKKILLLFSIISFISFADTPFKHEMRLGYDYSGETKAEGESFDHTVNLELVYEMYDEIYNNLDFGFGLILRREASAKDVTILNVNSKEKKLANFTPVYVTLKYRFPMEKLVPFIKLNLGYSYNHSSDFLLDVRYKPKDSLYYAAGTGIEFRNFIFDLSYQIINYEIKSSSDSINLENTRTTISFGYQFE